MNKAHLRKLVSGALGEAGRMEDGRAVWLSEVLVERATWGPGEAHYIGATRIADEGYIWVRFWLPQDEAVVTRVFDPEQRPVGTLIDVTMPLLREADSFETSDLVLDIWITPEERVVIFSEDAFEEAVQDKVLAAGEAKRAERHLRDLTAKIARRAFPPALVRNFQLESISVRHQVDSDS